MNQPWRVHIGYEFSIDGHSVYMVRKADDGANEAVVAASNGSLVVRRLDRNEQAPPLFTVQRERDSGILQGLAQELAQNGYGRFDSSADCKAKQAHIDSLEQQSDRLFKLAMRGRDATG